MTDPFLLITTSGNPWDPKTWSGVPYQLTSTFDKMGFLLGAFEGDFPKPIRYATLKTADWLYRLTRIESIAPSVHREPFMYRLRQILLEKRILYHSQGRPQLLLSINAITVPGPSFPYFVYADSILPQWQNKGLWCWDHQDRSRHICDRLNNQEKKVLSHAQHVFTMSEWARQAMLEQYGLSHGKVTAVGAGCTTLLGDIPPRNSYNNKRLLFVGKDFRRKGGFLLIEAFKIAKTKCPDLSLDIVGAQVRFQYDGIRVHGRVTWPVLRSLYEQASLFIMPSFLEAWGMVFLEAALARLPAIGLNQCATPEVIENGVTGRLAQPDASALAEVILELISQPSTLKKLGEAARNIALERWTWEGVIQKMLPALEAARRLP